MNNIKMRIMITAAIFLCAPLGYCQELSDWELGIFYDEAEWELTHYEDTAVEDWEAITQQFLNQKGITREQMEDIRERGLKMSFATAEEQVAQELKIKITEYMTLEQRMAILNDLANKYGMSRGQVGTVLARIQGEEE